MFSPVLVDRRRADHVQLAARQRRLQHVARRPSSPRRAPAPTTVCSSSMNRIRSSPWSRDLVDRRTSAAPRTRRGTSCPATMPARSSTSSRLPASVSGTSSFTIALGDALGDRRLADARVADQHRVVLGPPGEDLDRLLDLVGAADHRVELALARGLGEVAAVLVQRLGLARGPAALLGWRRRPRMTASAAWCARGRSVPGAARPPTRRRGPARAARARARGRRRPARASRRKRPGAPP